LQQDWRSSIYQKLKKKIYTINKNRLANLIFEVYL